ncbi:MULTISPECIES: hypothetical protein [Paenibacillus]|uniref:Uncharacterized protein n=1 Tax=Paenibacillus oleatilyticus TaxID=2594886 RepID=A0ABV4V449_9BACL|nr:MULTISPECIES: hypothetical protein [Paenibacillus]
MKKVFLSLMMGLILLSGIIPTQPTQPEQPTNMAALDDHGWGG